MVESSQVEMETEALRSGGAGAVRPKCLLCSEDLEGRTEGGPGPGGASAVVRAWPRSYVQSLMPLYGTSLLLDSHRAFLTCLLSSPAWQHPEDSDRGCILYVLCSYQSTWPMVNIQ